MHVCMSACMYYMYIYICICIAIVHISSHIYIYTEIYTYVCICTYIYPFSFHLTNSFAKVSFCVAPSLSLYRYTCTCVRTLIYASACILEDSSPWQYQMVRVRTGYWILRNAHRCADGGLKAWAQESKLDFLGGVWLRGVGSVPFQTQ